MSETKVKRLTQRLKELRDDYVVKKSEKEKLEKTLKIDYKIKTIDEALKRVEEVRTKIVNLEKKRDGFVEKAENLLDEYEEE